MVFTLPPSSNPYWLAMYTFYALVDPRDGLVRYVGRTRQERERRRYHLTTCRGTNAKKAWLTDLASEGIAPMFMVLERSLRDWFTSIQVERRWVEDLQDCGHSLLNREATFRRARR